MRLTLALIRRLPKTEIHCHLDGCLRPRTMLELAALVLELTGSASRLEQRPMPPDDPKQRQPDITAARSVLHWEPLVPLRDGLARTIEYFREVVASGR